MRALIRLEDPDCGEPKWFVASVAGNLNFEKPEEFFGDRTMEVTGLVLEKTNQLLTEIQEKEPSTLRAIGKGLKVGLATLGTVVLDVILEGILGGAGVSSDA